MTGGNRNVLIVDDDAEMRAVLRLMFQTEDFEVVGEAENGSEAVLVAGEQQPNVIVLDYKMPGMSAEETASVLRKITPDARIILFSAYVETEPDWPDAYLNKTEISKLVDCVEELLAS